MRRLLAILSVCTALGAGTAAAQEWVYTVRPGDNLWTLAARFCGSASYAERIATNNGLGDPARLRAGARLSIPVAWLVRQPASAEIVSVNGEAFLLVPTRRPAAAGDAIEMGQRLRTGVGSVLVRFADGATMQVSPDAELSFDVLTVHGDTGMVDTAVRFYRGRSTSRMIRRQPGSRYRISTPSGTAAVRGTEFRVGVRDAQTLTETLTGEVGFRQQAEVSLPAGFGLVADPGGARQESLLPAPTVRTPPGPLAQGEHVALAPVAGAAGYRFSIFRAADPDNPIRETLTDQPRLRLQALALGPYLVAVRAVAVSGLEGFETRVAIDIRAPAPLLRSEAEMVRGAARLAWEGGEAPFQVEVSGDGTFADPWRWTASDRVLSVSELPAGRYQWRVRGRDSEFSAPSPLVVLPGAVANLNARAGGVTGRALKVSWLAVSGAQRYLVEVSTAPDFVSDVVRSEVSGTNAELKLAGYGRHHVRVTVLEAGLSGEPVSVSVLAQRPVPWWLLPAAFVVLLAL